MKCPVVATMLFQALMSISYACETILLLRLFMLVAEIVSEF